MRRPARPATTLAFTAGLLWMFVASTSCAWGYAGQNDDEQTTESEADEDNPNVVVKKDEDEGDESDTGGTESTGSGTTGDAGDQPPCGVETFEIHYFDDSTQITKEIDCAERKVVSIKRNPISQKKLRTADKSGLPAGTWYVLVDPKDVRSKFLNNDQLIRISQEYDLQFLGRDENRDLLIYEYRGDL